MGIHRDWEQLRNISIQHTDDRDRHYSTLAMFAAIHNYASINNDSVARVNQTLATDITLRQSMSMHIDNSPFFWDSNALPLSNVGCRGVFHLTHGRIDLHLGGIDGAEPSPKQWCDLAESLSNDTADSGGHTYPSNTEYVRVFGRFSCRICLLAQAMTNRPTIYRAPQTMVHDAYIDHRIDAIPCLAAVMLPGEAARFRECCTVVPNVTHANRVTTTLQIMDIIEKHTTNDLSSIIPVSRQLLDISECDIFTLTPFQAVHVDWMLHVEHNGINRGWVLVVSDLWYNAILKSFWRGADPGLMRGGWLLYDMGMGKTCCVIALCRQLPRVESFPVLTRIDHNVDNVDVPYILTAAGTLVIVPVSLLHQWKHELSSKAPELKVAVYHGASRRRIRNNLDSYDVVLTTYHIVACEHTQRSRSITRWHSRMHTNNRTYIAPLETYMWSRIVADESHTLRDGTVITKSCCAIEAVTRWCLSATPMKTIDDMMVQATFLRDPILLTRTQRKSWVAWRYALRSNDSVTRVLASASRRVTRDSRLHGGQLTFIPAPMMRDVRVGMDVAARGHYNDVVSHALRMLEVRESGIAATRTLNAVRGYLSGSQTRMTNIIANVCIFNGLRSVGAWTGGEEAYNDECPICLGLGTGESAQTRCGHKFHASCLGQYFGTNCAMPCPICRCHLTLSDVTRDEAVASATHGASARSKCAWLDSVLQTNTMRKTLVFVDFIDSVELIQDVCIKNSVDSYTINGNMSALGRQQNIVAYEGHTGQAVFILTQRASSIGINLTSTTHIVLFEPGLYNAVERQAIGRAVRIGQVTLLKLYGW